MRTVIFDMDGLLMDSEPLWKAAMKKVWADHGIELTDEEYEETVGIPTDEIVKAWGKKVVWKGRTNEEIAEDIIAVTEKLLETKGKLKPGAKEILEFFKTRNFKMGLASSSPMRIIKGSLKRFEIEPYFQSVHSGENHVYGKPHPAVYLACAEELQTDPADCLVFEDSVNGMIAAKAAQMKVVAVPEAYNFDNPHYSLADLKLRSLHDFKEKHLSLLNA